MSRAHSLWLCSLGLLAVSCGPASRTVLSKDADATDSPAPIPTTEPPPPAQVEEPKPEPLAPPSPPKLDLTPHFPGPIADAFEAGDYIEAKSQLQLLGATSLPPETQARVAILMGHCDREIGQHGDAAVEFVAAINHPTLSDYATYQAARSYFALGAMDEAISYARKVDPKGRHRDAAALIIGGVLRAQNKWQEAADHYGLYLATGSTRITEARFRLAEALEKVNKQKDALAQYKLVGVEAPLSSWARKARARELFLLRRLPKRKRLARIKLSGPQYIQRGMAYFRAHRNPLAARSFKKALDTKQLNPDETCVAAFHRAESWWKQRNRTRSAPLFDVASTLCDKAKNDDLAAKAKYQAGRSYDRLEKELESIKRLQRVEKDHPKHSYADDAALRISESHEELGDEASADKVLATIPKKYPKGDIKGLALWRLAFREFKAKQYQRTIELLTERKRLIPIEKNWKFEGQAEYWLGRAHGELGQTAQALAFYEETIRTYPLTYYSLLALNRMREMDTARYQALLADLKQPPKVEPYEPSDAAATLAGTPGFERGIELLRLGLGSDAAAEFSAIGLAAPPGKKEVTDPAEQKKLWLMAFLFDRAGRQNRSHWPTRWHILDYRRHWPEGGWKTRWRIAYPRAFWDLLDKYAKLRGHPTELQIAFVREESAFNPNLESWANAIGLTQMIFPTARQYGRGTGIRINRANLRDPEKNVIIGSNFLKSLLDRYQRQVALAVPAYNAGPNRLNRWRKNIGDVPQDVFAESIFGDQPRGYAKRVIGSYFAYSYLETGNVPVLPLELR